MARVGLDLDGVVYDFVDAYRNYLENIFGNDTGSNGYPEPTRWEFFKDWGISEEDFGKDLRENPHIFTEGKPYPGAVEAVKRLAEAGHTIYFITDRSIMGDVAHDRTGEWLSQHGILWDYLYVTADKTSVDVDYFIDDKPENVQAMLDKGIDAYLCHRPWNESATSLDGKAMTLEQFVEYVLVKAHYRSTEGADHLGGEVRVTSATGGQKGKKRARFDLIPAEALWKVAELYGAGAEKYDDWNWRKGYDWSLSLGALERHLSLFKGGQSLDDETKCHHLASVVFHALALMTFEEECPEYDDRWKRDAS